MFGWNAGHNNRYGILSPVVGTGNTRKERNVNSATEQIVVTTPDMSCGHCVASIEQGVSALAGVENVKADLGTKQVTISFDPARVTVPQIEETLDEAGYPVAK